MPQINLLPWREELRSRRKKEFAVTAGIAVLATLGIVGLVHLQYDHWIEHQNDRNRYLESEISKLNKAIQQIKDLDEEKQRLLARMEIIQQLQDSRPEIVHVMDELVTTIPDGVFFNKITQKGRTLTLNGMAQSNARVSSLMRNLEASDWFENPELVEIKANRGRDEFLRLSAFSLRISQAKQTQNEDTEGGSS